MAVLPKSHISVMVLGFFSFLCEQLNDIYFLHFFFFSGVGISLYSH